MPEDFSYDKALKSIISEVFEQHLDAKLVTIEFGIMLKEFSIDVFVIKAKPKKKIPENSWIGFIINNAKDFLIIEAKHVGSRLSRSGIIQVLAYKFILSKEKNYPLDRITPVLIVSKLPRDANKLVRSVISPEVSIVGKGGLYKIVGVRALEMLVIAVDELSLDVEYNETLVLFSSSFDRSLEAAGRILARYSPDTFIYAFTLIYRPEVVSMAKVELVSPSKLRLAINAIGIEKLAEALGPEELAKIITKLLKQLPKEKVKEIIEKQLKEEKHKK